MTIYVPMVIFPEGDSCDYLLMGFTSAEEARDLHPDAVIMTLDFPEVNPMNN